MTVGAKLALLSAAGAAACGGVPSAQPPAAVEETTLPTIVPFADAQWDQLNPARGNQSPKAATLWGDRRGTAPTGFLFHPVDGFESPPHIHNVSYRGIVVRGLVHNDHPDSIERWMPAGSFWTQPKGAVHITSARGADTLAYIEIDAGPYLVAPAEKAFASDERPLNLDASNIVWVTSPGSSPQIRVAHLWGAPDGGGRNGSLLKLPGGFDGIFTCRPPVADEAVHLKSDVGGFVNGRAVHRAPTPHDCIVRTLTADLQPD